MPQGLFLNAHRRQDVLEWGPTIDNATTVEEYILLARQIWDYGARVVDVGMIEYFSVYFMAHAVALISDLTAMLPTFDDDEKLERRGGGRQREEEGEEVEEGDGDDGGDSGGDGRGGGRGRQGDRGGDGGKRGDRGGDGGRRRRGGEIRLDRRQGGDGGRGGLVRGAGEVGRVGEVLAAVG